MLFAVVSEANFVDAHPHLNVVFAENIEVLYCSLFADANDYFLVLFM